MRPTLIRTWNLLSDDVNGIEVQSSYLTTWKGRGEDRWGGWKSAVRTACEWTVFFLSVKIRSAALLKSTRAAFQRWNRIFLFTSTSCSAHYCGSNLVEWSTLAPPCHSFVLQMLVSFQYSMFSPRFCFSPFCSSEMDSESLTMRSWFLQEKIDPRRLN